MCACNRQSASVERDLHPGGLAAPVDPAMVWAGQCGEGWREGCRLGTVCWDLVGKSGLEQRLHSAVG